MRPLGTGAEHAVVQDKPTSGTATRPPELVARSPMEGTENDALTVMSVPAGEMLQETASAAMQLVLKPSNSRPAPEVAERWIGVPSRTRVMHVAVQLVAPAASHLKAPIGPCVPENEPPPETFSVKTSGGWKLAVTV